MRLVAIGGGFINPDQICRITIHMDFGRNSAKLHMADGSVVTVGPHDDLKQVYKDLHSLED